MKRVTILLAGMLAIASPQPTAWAQAAAKPDFSGTWIMAKDKSDFGGMPSPDKIIRVIDHKEPAIHVKTTQSQPDQPDATPTMVNYKSDGSETKNDIRGMAATSKAHWDGAVLLIETKLKAPNDSTLTFNEKWELSEDKKFLNTTSRITTPEGEVTLKLVSERQDSKQAK